MRIFTRGTKLYEMEVIMVGVPNFEPRASGIRRYKLKKDPKCNCTYCTHYTKNVGCIKSTCQYLSYRISLGELGYRAYLNEKHKHKSKDFRKRLLTVSDEHNGTMFVIHRHELRFYDILSPMLSERKGQLPNTNIVAAIYLLSGSVSLWEQVKEYVSYDKIEFEKIKLKSISTVEYMFYQMARTICDNIPRITDAELIDAELTSDIVFKCVINASTIQDFGVRTLVMFDK